MTCGCKSNHPAGTTSDSVTMPEAIPVARQIGDGWYPARLNLGLGDFAARALCCHGCPELVDRNCGLSDSPVQLHIDGKPCPRDAFPDAQGQCSFIGTKTHGAPKLLRWYAKLTGYHFDTHLNDCGCFVPLKLGWTRVLSLLKGTSA